MSSTPIIGRNISFSDSFMNLARNDAPALGLVPQLLARGVQNVQHRGRPLFHFWGNWTSVPVSFFASPTATYTFARFNMLDGGCKSERGLVHGIPGAGDLSPTAGLSMDGYLTRHSEGHGAGANYPNGLITMDMRNAATDTDPAVAPGYPSQQTVVADTMLPMSGCVYEDSVEAIHDLSTSVSTTGFASGRDIIATQTSNYGTLEQLRERLTHVWMNRRPMFQWAALPKGGGSADRISFTLSPQQYRYLFDQDWGTGGTAPSATGPAITLPIRYSAAGLNKLVRVYVWVRAAMSGATDGGTIGVANKDASGTMTAFRDLTNPQTIGGTGLAWYPSLGAFNPATNPYFLANANVPFDRVLIGGKSNGATDSIEIANFVLAVYPSEA